MTTSTSETTEPTFDDLLATDAAETSTATAADTAAHDQADAAAAHRDAENARRATRERRQMTAAWIALALGLVISLGTFGAIAWQHSVAANGTTPAVSTTAP
jgi:hypothetical protein